MAKSKCGNCQVCDKPTTVRTGLHVTELGRAGQATLVIRDYHLECYKALTPAEKHEREMAGNRCSDWCESRHEKSTVAAVTVPA